MIIATVIALTSTEFWTQLIAYSVFGALLFVVSVIITWGIRLYNRITHKEEKRKARLQAQVLEATPEVLDVFSKNTDGYVSEGDIAKKVLSTHDVIKATLEELHAEGKVEAGKGDGKCKEWRRIG